MKPRPYALITGHDALFAKWAADRLPYVGELGFGPCRAVGVATGATAHDRLLAVVVFHSFQPTTKTVQISCAAVSPMWARREAIRELLRIAFEDFDCNMVWMAIPHTNERAIRFNKSDRGMGMKMAGPLRHMFGPGVHAVHMSMTRNEWARRWKEASRERQVIRAAAA